MPDQGRHRILLINFEGQDAVLLKRKGFNVEEGKVGRIVRSVYGAACVETWLPHPPFDYDVYAFNSKIAELRNPPTLMWAHTSPLNTLATFEKAPSIRISFTGGSPEYDPVLLGGPLISVEAADVGVSSFNVLAPNSPFSLPSLHEAVGKLAGVPRRVVGQYIRGGAGAAPHYHIPVVASRNADVVAAYGVYFREPMREPRPVYVILPQLEDNARALLGLLELFVELTPEVFPDIQKRAWYESEELAFREEREIAREIERRRTELSRFVESKESERKAVRDKFDFIKRILIATETEANPALRLSTSVKKVLEFLDFEVEDIDAQMRGAIKKEDFWARDGEFIAITEVSGTKNKNPKTKEYNDLLGRMTTVYKRKDLVPQSERVTGLLILNYDLETHPFRRPRLFSGGEEEYVSAAREHSIGLLSTVELYRIAVAAKDGEISKEKARRLIKQFGRIELPLEEPPIEKRQAAD
jgi:hypothetical protein